MGISEEKQKKLAYVARRYYLDDRKQSDIAKELGVSRPLVSRMLAEAREHGVVELRIHDPAARQGRLVEQLRRCPNIIGVCSANTSVRALQGALKTGLFTHLVARADLVRSALA